MTQTNKPHEIDEDMLFTGVINQQKLMQQALCIHHSGNRELRYKTSKCDAKGCELQGYLLSAAEIEKLKASQKEKILKCIKLARCSDDTDEEILTKLGVK